MSIAACSRTRVLHTWETRIDHGRVVASDKGEGRGHRTVYTLRVRCVLGLKSGPVMQNVRMSLTAWSAYVVFYRTCHFYFSIFFEVLM